MGKLIDLTGQRFGRLTVLRRDESVSGHGKTSKWICQCDCGNIKSIDSYSLRLGPTTSCGCYQKEKVSEAISKHYSTERIKLDAVWRAMIQRCERESSKSYRNYGGRGISVCERWHSIDNFLADMQPTYRIGLQLDRIDNNGNYEPSNCHWVTPKENSHNIRTNVWVTAIGTRRVQAAWARAVGRHNSTFEHFLDKHRADGDIIIEGGVRDNTGLPKKSQIPDDCPWELTPDGSELQRRCSA